MTQQSTFSYEEKHVLSQELRLLISVSQFDDLAPFGVVAIVNQGRYSALCEQVCSDANTPEGMIRAIHTLRIRAANELRSWAEKIMPRDTVSQSTKDTISQLMHKYNTIEEQSVATYADKNKQKEDYYGGP